MRAALAILLLTLPVFSLQAAESDAGRVWEFRVLLDGKDIGSHRFELQERDGFRRLVSTARFDVRFLFFTAYRYRHHAEEAWRDDCLLDLEARTVRNGETLEVSGDREEGAFVVTSGKGSETLPACVMTFAYWNPDILEARRLLNPQTGEYLDVDVEAVEAEALEVRGRTIEARAYRLTAKDMKLRLWYSPDNEWLALESEARGGRTIRYELT